MTIPIACFMVSLGQDGRVLSQKALPKAIPSDRVFMSEVNMADSLSGYTNRSNPDRIDPGDGKLVTKEEISEGHVGWQACEHTASSLGCPNRSFSVKMYFLSLGGERGAVFWLTFLGGFMLCELFYTIQSWWLGVWAQQYENHSPLEVSASL